MSEGCRYISFGFRNFIRKRLHTERIEVPIDF